VELGPQALNDYWVTALPEVKWSNYCPAYLHSNSTRSCSVQKSLLRDFSAAKSLMTSSKSTERINSDAMHISYNVLSLVWPMHWYAKVIFDSCQRRKWPFAFTVGDWKCQISLRANPTLGNVDSKIPPCALNSPFINYVLRWSPCIPL